MPLASIIFKANFEQRVVMVLITWIVVPENLCHHHIISSHPDSHCGENSLKLMHSSLEEIAFIS